jgi:ankyrin repeat protein
MPSVMIENNKANIKRWLYTFPASSHEGQLTSHMTARTGDRKTAERLTEQGIEIEEPDSDGWTALHLMAWNMLTDMITFLFMTARPIQWISAQTHNYYFCALHLVMYNNDGEMIKMLVQISSA